MAKICNFSDFTGPVETSLKNIYRKHGQIFVCRHLAFELDTSTRTVCCKECGEIVDAFDVLREFAYEQRTFLWQVEKYKAAKEEFERIQSEWSLTTREKRRIDKATQQAKCPELYREDKQ